MERNLSFGRACSRVALSLVFAASFAYAAPTKSWTVVDLTPDSAAGGLARDVNNRGDVVGHTFTQTGALLLIPR